MKSTSAPVVAVEEPDDCNANIKGQGDTIKNKDFPGTKDHFRRYANGGRFKSCECGL